jgi:RNA polymerase sigma factor (sigma-70 family)
MTQDIETLVREAQEGKREALEAVVAYAQGYVYNLALRMLQVPADAEDATQDILIRMVTHLAQYRGESAFSTWMYRLASNHLLNVATRSKARRQVSFDGMAGRLEESLARYEETPEEAYENTVLAEEVRRSCSLGMLMCLDEGERLALVLTEIAGVSSEDGAEIVGISPAAYRKRVSRARQALVGFVARRCGLVNEASPCRCHKHVANTIAIGRMNPEQLQYAEQTDAACGEAFVRTTDNTLDPAGRTMALMRAHPTYAARADFVAILRQTLSPAEPD